MLQVVVYLASTVKAECCGCPISTNCELGLPCNTPDPVSFFPSDPNCCDDCSECTPYCGNGKCNIFGCHCTDGCRQDGLNRKPSSPFDFFPLRSSPEDIAYLQFRSIDKDNNGAIDIKEALFYFLDNNLLTSVSEFTKGLQEADKNGDSFISPKEFDNSLADVPEKNLTATFTL